MAMTTSWTERVARTKKLLGYPENLTHPTRRRTDPVGYIERKLGCTRAEAAGLVDAVEQDAERMHTLATSESAVRGTRAEGAREVSEMVWARCWVVSRDGTEVIACEASTSPDGTVTVRQVGGAGLDTPSYEVSSYERLYGATPEEAVEKFLHRLRQQIIRWRLNIDRVEAAVASAEALRLVISQGDCRAVPATIPRPNQARLP